MKLLDYVNRLLLFILNYYEIYIYMFAYFAFGVFL